MAKCITKGCAWEALPKQQHCRNHSEELPESLMPHVPKSKDYEIVPMSQVPPKGVVNFYRYNLAKAVAVLSKGNALKVSTKNRTDANKIGSSVVAMCKLMGVRAFYQRGVDCVFIFKAEERPDAP
jgi:hypothetical protein